MTLTIATWNINSVRLRQDLVTDFLKSHQPEILCLQETKVPDEKFPRAAFEALGYEHIAVAGQKGYHGVATLSRIPFEAAYREDWCGRTDARHVVVRLADDIEIHNFYVPAGGDIPDPEVNDKFRHKLDFLDEMTSRFTSSRSPEDRLVLVGDLNIAPLETDVWSHRQLLNVVSHTPIEVEKLTRFQESLDFIDVTRHFIPPSEPLFTWWSYRARDGRQSNRGRRLDHIWVTPALKAGLRNSWVIPELRDQERPSDHIPVLAEIML